MAAAHTGPSAPKDETGKRYGLLSVVGAAGRDSHGCKLWLCQCDCGNQITTRGDSIRWGDSQNGRGGTRSCGCLKKKDPSLLVPDRIKSMRQAFNNMRQNAHKRGIPWALPDDILEHLCAQNCRYCNAPPANAGLLKFKKQYVYSGIDRTDNTKGYTVDNVVPCCSVCNMAKSDLTMSDFITWVERISQNLLNR
jgi:hypothetical protein